MAAYTRREFLQVSGAALIQPCVDPPAGGELVGLLPLGGIGADAVPLEQKLDSGLDARLFTDLSTLAPDRLITPNQRFYIRTEYPDRFRPEPDHVVRIRGLDDREIAVAISDLRRRAEPFGPHLMECAGNNNPNFGLMSVASWSGVRLDTLLENVAGVSKAPRVRVSGFDDHSRPSRTSVTGAAWIFTLVDLASTGAFLAVAMNGEPVPRNHGAPVRLVVPGWYGCASIKWVDDITLVPDEAAATSQMKEFAARTHQERAFDLARDYAPPSIELAATPIRVEKWRARGRLTYRVVGIAWGGTKPVEALEIRFNAGEPYRPFRLCPAPRDHFSWTVWSYDWQPVSAGRYHISLQAADRTSPARRLDLQYYTRSVWLDEV